MARGLAAVTAFTAPPHLRGSASCVTPGVWAVAVPFPGFLGHSHCYIVRVGSGVIVVDLGWDSDDGWDAFQVGLLRSGASLSDVIGVVITHAHPDHFGLAERVRQHTTAWIAGHAAEQGSVLATASSQRQRTGELEDWLRACGAPPRWLSELAGDALTLNASTSGRSFDIQLDHHQIVPDSAGALRAWHTPGHTAGHLCFVDEQRKLLFSGDHLLPRVTPNVSKRPGSALDPVDSYLASLRAVDALTDDYLVLPGHEWSFERPAQRSAEIRVHLRQRLDEVAQALACGARTVWDVTRSLTWSRPFETLNVRGQRQALGETHAYLHYLAERGSIGVSAGRPMIWAVEETRAITNAIEERPEESRK